MLLIQNKDKIYQPCVPESVTWTLTRQGAPGKLAFKVMQDDVLDFEEGNIVQFGVGKTKLFKGYVFSRKQSKDNIVSVTAYDQLRYLKNKDVYAFIGKTAKEIICQIADDFQLKHKDKDGNEAICDTDYVIPRLRASNETLFDTMQTALDHTLIYGKVTTASKDGKTESVPKGYVLYDNFGVLTLSEIGTLDVDILIDSESAENFDFESTIDRETYNKINLYEDDKEAGKRERYIAQDSANIKRWGILQKCDSIDSKKCANPAAKAANLLKQYNAAKKTLSIKAAFGDTADRPHLIERALERGLTPKKATYAKVKGTFTPDTVNIPIGTTFSYDDLDYTVAQKISAGEYYLTCNTLGTVGNQPADTMIPNDYVKGLQSAMLTEVIVPGEDEEDTEVFRKRYLSSFDSQAYGGNIPDYKEKVNAISGVGGVKVYPVWNGGGTVKIVFMTSEFKVPTAEFVLEVQNMIDPVKYHGLGLGIAPIGHTVTVEGVSDSSISISMTLTADTLAESYREDIEKIIDEYFLELNKGWQDTKTDSIRLTLNKGITVRLAQIESRVLNLAGVDDVQNLTLNDNQENLVLDVNAIFCVHEF